MGHRFRLPVLILFELAATITLAQTAAPAKSAQMQQPRLSQRPTTPAQTSLPPDAIRIDVLVRDEHDKPVEGLPASAFTVMDNGKPQPLIAFAEAPDVGGQQAATQVILVMDAVNTGLDLLAEQRQQLEAFLRRNDGKLDWPTSIFWLTDEGLHVEPRPSLNGNDLADLLHHIDATVRTVHRSAGAYGLIENMEISLRSVELVLNNAQHMSGRKLVIWIGPGWAWMRQPPDVYMQQMQSANFSTFTTILNGLRTGGVELCATDAGDAFYLRDYLYPLKRPEEFQMPELSLPALSLLSGGQTFDTNNGRALAKRITACESDAGSFYQLVFHGATTTHADEDHQLKVSVERPKTKVRTIAAYYAEPH